MIPRRLLVVLAVAIATVLTAPAHAAVGEQPPTSEPAFATDEVIVHTEQGARIKKVREGEGVREAARRWRAEPGVRWAGPSPVARISGWIPNDPGRRSWSAGGWARLQWNFGAGVGVNAPKAWQHLRRAGRPGGRGVVVAVLDTGVAYRTRGRFRRSPDLRRKTFVRGYDFVARNAFPHDRNGHGTHVASTIAEAANNGIGVTGLAYGARVMPVRVLDRYGEGNALAISRGIRYAADRGADVINLSFEFSASVTARQIPDIMRALRYATRKGVLVVGAAGNDTARAVAFPARSSYVLAVGATTDSACQADYSNIGSHLDLAAPGGGADATIPGDPNCRRHAPGRDIFQMTFTRNVRTFGLPSGYVGTSMAAPHVSATAALVIASGVLGGSPSAGAVAERLRSTARDLGPPGRDRRYGHGLVDAARATAPAR
jgi:serine protease